LISEKSISESNEKISTPENHSQFKTIQEKTVNGDKVFTIVAVDDEEGYSLAESIQNLGPITPIYYMADGVTLVDGFHRLTECPNAQYTKIILKNCITEVDRVLYSTAINFNRRKGTSEELKKNIVFLATEGHLSVKEIVAKIGLSHTTVDRYYPKPLKDQEHSQLGIASGKARALKATQQPAESTEVKELQSIHVNTFTEKEPLTSTVLPVEPELLNDNPVPNWERQTKEPTSEEKIDALIAENNEEQQTLEKLISDAKADLPDDFKHAVYNLAVDPSQEFKQKRLNECLTVAVEVLLDFIEQEGTLQELLKTAKERW
jgi:hypothetical protein